MTHGQDLDNQGSAELCKCPMSPSTPPPLDTSLSGIVKAGFPSVALSLSTHHTVSTYTSSLEGKKCVFSMMSEFLC